MSQRTQLFVYNRASCQLKSYGQEESISLISGDDHWRWLNQYLDDDTSGFHRLIKENGLDEFLINLLSKSYKRNKLIELSNVSVLFAKTIRSKARDNGYKLTTEQIIFVVGERYIWSIQEEDGDEFDHIRQRLIKDQGVVRKRSLDYLLYLMIEAIVEHYFEVLDQLVDRHSHLTEAKSIRATPEFSEDVEAYKNQLFFMSRSIIALRESLVQMNIMDEPIMGSKYLNEVLAQIQSFSDQLDHQLQKLESAVNLIFSIQNHKLNEIMKALTIISVVFIPLSFVAGLYGMNFSYMPELQQRNGYFIVLGIMLCIVLVSIWLMKRKRWF